MRSYPSLTNLLRAARSNARRVADHLFADSGHRLVLVTHDLELARRCEVAVLVEDGRLHAVGDAAAIAERYEERLRC